MDAVVSVSMDAGAGVETGTEMGRTGRAATSSGKFVFENRRSAHFLVNATVGRDTDFKKRTGITFFSCKTPPNSFTRLPHTSNTDADTVGPTLSHALVDTLAVVSDGNDQLAIPMLQHHLGVACSRMLEHTIQEHRTALNLVPASCRLGWHSTTKDGSNREGLPGLESR
jgi:hypothetical protein